MLLNETYTTSKYTTFTIYEPKERLIYKLPYFPDRIVQHAIVNVLGPVWDNLFIHNTFASIKGRGIHACLKCLRRDLRKYKPMYCLKLDVRKFYPSIDHDILKSIIRKKIGDEKLLRLLDSIIDSAPGLPIGNYLSQYLANLYLTYFDHYVKEVLGVKFYYRYADDLVLLGNSKTELHRIRKDIEEYLKINLNLEIKKSWQVFPIDVRGIDFLGYVFRTSHILLRKTLKYKLKRAKTISPGRLGWLIWCNSKHLKHEVYI